MPFKIKQKDLAEIVAMPAKLPKASNIIPVAECLRMIFGATGVSVSATDFDKWLTINTEDYKGKQEFAALVPVRGFYSVLAAIPPETEITFTGTPKKLTMKTKTSTYNFGSLPLDEWPDVKLDDKMSKITIQAGELIEAFQFVLPSVATDDSRYYLNGVHVSQVKSGLRFCSTNGHKLAHYILESVKKMELPAQGIILPRETVRILMDIITKLSPDVSVEFAASESKCVFTIGNGNPTILKGKLIDGQFPDADRVIPYDRDSTQVSMPRVAVMGAVNRISLVSGSESRRVAFFFDGDILSLRGQNSADDAEEQIEVKGVKKMDTAMNARYLNDILGTFSGDDFFMLVDEGRATDGPVVISEKVPVTKESKCFAIIMPMR